ncbi:MAG: hypothetical protein ACJ8MH_13510, partial [Povalibacter sp.]
MHKGLVILTLTTAACGASSAYLYQQLGAERERSQGLEHQLKAVHEKVAIFSAVARPAPVFASTGATASQQAPTPARKENESRAVYSARLISRSAPEPDDDLAMRQRFVREQQALMQDPEYRTALRQQQRIQMMRQYPYLAEDLGLSKEDADRLMDVLADQQLDAMQDANAVDPETLQSDPAAMAQYQRKMEERQRAQQAALTQVLGSDGMQRWQEYQNTMAARFRTQQLRQALDAAGVPLEPDQERALRHALATHVKKMEDDAQTFASKMSTRGAMTAEDRLKMEEEQLERTESYYERARQSVAGILTSEQMDQYKSIHDQELMMRRAQLRVRRAQLEANGGESELSGPQMGWTSAPGGVTTTISVSD